jgi:predicted dehydrogenase
MGSLHYKNLKKIRGIELLTANSNKEFEKEINSYKIDGVVLSVPFTSNYNMAKRALIAGSNVFVEKPMSTTYKEARDLVTTTKKNKKILMVGQILRFFETFEVVKSILDSGKIGELKSITCRRYSKKIIKDWWKDSDRFLLLFEGIHTIDILKYLLESYPKEISGKVSRTLKELKGDSEFLVDISFNRKVYASIHHKITPNLNCNEILFSGEGGCIFVKDFSEVYLNEKRVFKRNFIKLMNEGSYAEMKEFIGSIKGNRQPLSSGEDVLKSMKIVEDIYSSSGN